MTLCQYTDRGGSGRDHTVSLGWDVGGPPAFSSGQTMAAAQPGHNLELASVGLSSCSDEEAQHRPEEALGLCHLYTVLEVLLEGDATSSWPPYSMQNPTK